MSEKLKMVSRFLLLLLFSKLAFTQTIVWNIPGFDGDLPFTLETGYIGVGESNEVQLFYYFIESEGNPNDDPLLLWLAGGPGCSGFSGLLYEIGPVTFDYAKCKGNNPVLKLNPYSWTKVANIIFIDAPAVSYATNSQGYNISDRTQGSQDYEFSREWLSTHRKYIENSLYITCDSYSGKIFPLVVQNVTIGIDPPLNLKGYTLGNPVTDVIRDGNSRIEFAYLKGLISDKLYQSLKQHCKGQYVDVDPTNVACINDLQWYEEDDNYKWSEILLNNKTVQKALGVREGTILKWKRCATLSSYTYNLPSSVEIHRHLIKRGYKVLIYSGDHDMLIPYVGTFTWVESLNLSIAYDWAPWFVKGQVAGYTLQYRKSPTNYQLTSATVKGAGHTAPEFKPRQCFDMINRWLSHYLL